MDIKTKAASAAVITFPSNYDVAGWNEFYSSRPHFRRSVGAEGDNSGEGGEEKPGEGAGDDKAAKAAADAAAAEVAKGKPDVDALVALVAKLEDEKANLLKDTMKNKAGKKTVETELGTVQSKLKELFGDVPLEEVKIGLENQRKAEVEALRKSGEFDKLKDRMAAEHKKALDTASGEYGVKVKDLTSKLENSENEIRRLLVTNAFASSSYLSDEMTLTPAKAEKLYGDHFKVEEHDGRRQVVAYAEGNPLVNAEGKFIAFEDAFKEIVNRDPEKETVIKSKAKPGAGSGVDNKGNVEMPTKPLRGVAAIQAGLGKMGK